MQKNENDLFTSMDVKKAVAKLAIPTVVSQIVVILYSLADTFYVGQIGVAAQLSALSVTFPIYQLLTAVANFFGIGANSVISRSLGKNDKESAKKASSFGFWTSIIVTLILSVLLFIFLNPILNFMGANGDILLYSSKYLFWVFVIGGIPTVMGLILGHLVRSVGKTKEAGFGLSLGGIMNIILDPLFIFSKGDQLLNGLITMPFGFGMGVSGAAIATMLSNLISAIYFVYIFIKIRKEVAITINPKKYSLDKNVYPEVCAVGFPAAISVALLSVSIAVITGLLLTYSNGDVLTAAYGVTSKIGTIALHITLGISQGVMPLIGFSYGAKNYKRAHDVCNISFKILLTFSIIFLVLVQFMPNFLAQIFTPNPQVIEVASTFMRCWSWCVIGMSMFSMYNAIFQAVGKWKTSLILSVLRLGIIFNVLAFSMNALWGVTGLMWVQAITDTVTFLIAAALYNEFKKKEAPHVDEQAIEDTGTKALNRVIAISREFGSGGRTIAKEVAKSLNIPCYDNDIIDKIALETGFSKEYIEEYDENAIANTIYGNVVAGRNVDGRSDMDTLWLTQQKVIIELANKAPCVIVGRGADYILKNKTDCLSVFIYASDEKRMQRIVDVYGERDESPKQRLEEKDKKRRAYYELYTGTAWGEHSNYDICLNSGELGIEKCVEIIKGLF